MSRFVCLTPQEQAIVSKGTVKNTSSLVLSYFFEYFQLQKAFLWAIIHIIVHINVLGRTIPEKETYVFDLLKSASRRRYLRIL